MIYTLCIHEPHLRIGFFRRETFTDLRDLERARMEAIKNPRVKCWVA